MQIIKSRNGIDIYVDDIDYLKAMQYVWAVYQDKHIRVVTYDGLKRMSYSAVILGIDPKKQGVFHKNGKSTDYIRNNIIICDRSELVYLINERKDATSKYHGVHFNMKFQKWKVSVRKGGVKGSHFGYYSDEDEAGLVADYFAIDKYGDLAKRNFPKLTYNELQLKYEQILERYGSDNCERIARGNQGRKKENKLSKSSQFCGVVYNKKQGKWISQIGYQKKHINIGTYEREVDAALAYDTMALKLYGDYAKLNFPCEKEKITKTNDKEHGLSQ